MHNQCHQLLGFQQLVYPKYLKRDLQIWASEGVFPGEDDS